MIVIAVWKIKEERNNQTRNEWVRSILPVNLDAGAAHGFTWFAYNIQQKKEMVDMNRNHFSCLFTTREKNNNKQHITNKLCAHIFINHAILQVGARFHSSDAHDRPTVSMKWISYKSNHKYRKNMYTKTLQWKRHGCLKINSAYNSEPEA